MVSADRLRQFENAIRARHGKPLRPHYMAAILRSPTKKPRARRISCLHVWRVPCPNNKHLTTLVTSPIKPHFCPVCGGRSASVNEMEPV